MVGEKISLRKRVGLAVLTVLMLLSAVFGAIFMRGIFGDATQTAKAEIVETVGKTDVRVGATDCTTVWAQETSRNVLTEGQQARITFTNYNKKQLSTDNKPANGKNWIAIVWDLETNAFAANFQADRWERIQDAIDGVTGWDNIPNNYDDDLWNNFSDRMNGSNVVVTFTHFGSYVKIRADITASNNASYYEEFNVKVDGHSVQTFITVDESYIIVSEDTGVTSASYKTQVGVEGNTTGYYGDKSDMFSLDEVGQKVVFNFINTSSKNAVWSNWNVVIVEDEHANTQKLVYRSDNWYNGEVFTGVTDQSVVTNTMRDSEDNFKERMDGATVTITVTRMNDSITIHALSTRTIDEVAYIYELSLTQSSTDRVYTFLVPDQSCIKDLTVHKYYATLRYNSDSHWDECILCNGKINSASHDFGNYTETDDTNHSRTCSVCGYVETSEHNFGVYTSTDNENHSRTCADCGYVETVEHTFGDWTKVDGTYHKHTCTDCGYEATAAHTYTNGEYFYDSNNHWQLCTACENKNETEHSLTDGSCACGYATSMNLVGATDFSTAYLGDKSDIVTLSKGEIVTFTFTNFCNETDYAIYKNWLGVVYDSNDASLSEWRSDGPDVKIAFDTNWDWGKASTGVTGPSDVTYGTMNEATVVLVYTHTGSGVTMSATVSSKDKTVSYTMRNTVHEVSGDSVVEKSISDPVKVCVSVDHAYLTNVSYKKTYISYDITYDLADGSVAQENPASYTKADTFTLTNPTKVGCTFAGWTGTDLDEATQSVTIPAGSTGDREYTANWTEISATTITGHNVVLGGDIGVTFTVQFKAGENEGSYMIFTFEDGRASQRVDTAVLTNNCYSYTVKVNAMELAETFTATLYSGNGETIVTDNYSVMQYIDTYKTSSIRTDKGVAILNALQNYGYYMQSSGWKDDLADHVAIDKCSDIDLTHSSSEVVSAISGKAINKDAYTGTIKQSLTLNADTKINLFFENNVEIVEGDFSAPVSSNGLYKSTSGSINIKNLGENKTVKIQDAGTEYTITVNGLSYLYAALNGGNLTTQKVNALIAYYEYYLATQAI